MIALVTGGSSGIGYAFPVNLGYDLILVGRTLDTLVARRDWRKYKVRFKFYCRCHKPRQGKNDEYEVIMILVVVNNAGIGLSKDFVIQLLRKMEIVDLNVVPYTILWNTFIKSL